jgi:hypothetical protein
MSNRLLTSIIFVLLFSSSGLLSAGAIGADHNNEQALLQMEVKWLAAQDDPSSLESILADDFIHVLPMGFVTRKEQLDYMRSHPVSKREARHFEDLRVYLRHRRSGQRNCGRGRR